MDRINIFDSDDPEGEPYLLGWFDKDRATRIDEETTWNGNGHVSVHTHTQFMHQGLYRTAGGRWVLCRFSDWQGSQPTYEFVTDDEARSWLLVNHSDAEAAEYFGPVEDERGPGRPTEGKKVEVRLDEATITAADARAAEEGRTRAALLRDIITAALTPAEVVA